MTDIYTWTRNSGLTVQSLVHGLIAGTKSLETLIQQYVTSQAKLQTMPNPSGNLSDGANLGEPKFNINLTAFNQPWAVPRVTALPRVHLLSLHTAITSWDTASTPRLLRTFGLSSATTWDTLANTGTKQASTCGKR